MGSLRHVERAGSIASCPRLGRRRGVLIEARRIVLAGADAVANIGRHADTAPRRNPHAHATPLLAVTSSGRDRPPH